MALSTDYCLRCIWPRIACPNGSFLEVQITRDNGGPYSGGNRLAFLYNPTSTITFTGDGAPFILNRAQIAQKFLNSQGQRAIDSFNLDMFDRNFYTAVGGGNENFASVQSTTLLEFFNLDSENDRPYWIWIKLYNAAGTLIDIPFCGTIRANYKPTNRTRYRNPHTNAEIPLTQVRSVQCISAIKELSEHSWAEVIARTKEADTVSATFYGGYAFAPDISWFDEYQRYGDTINGHIGSHNMGMVYAAPYYGLGGFASSDGSFRAGARHGFFDWFPTFLLPGLPYTGFQFATAWPIGTHAITLDKVVEKMAEVVDFGYTADDFVGVLAPMPQQYDSTTNSFPVLAGTPRPASGINICYNVYFGAHPLDGVTGSGGFWDVPHLACRVMTSADLGGTYTPGTGSFHGLGANILLGPQPTVDGVTLGDGDRVLVNGQTATNENGIYIVTSTSGTYSLTRAVDMDGSSASFLMAFNEDKEYVLIGEGNFRGDFFLWQAPNYTQTSTSFDFDTTDLTFHVTDATNAIWQPPCAFKAGDNIDSCLLRLSYYRTCEPYYTTDLTTGVPQLKFRAIGTSAGTLPANWETLSSKEVAPSRVISNVDGVCMGDDLHTIAPISRTNPYSIQIPLRHRRIGQPTVTPLPLQTYDDAIFDASITKLADQLVRCFCVAVLEPEIDGSGNLTLDNGVVGNPDVWKGLCFTYYLNNGAGMFYPPQNKGVTEWSTLSNSFTNDYFGGMFAHGCNIPVADFDPPPRLVKENFDSRTWPVVIFANHFVTSGTCVEREYRGTFDDSGLFSTIDVGLEASWFYNRAINAFRAIELFRDPRANHAKILWQKLLFSGSPSLFDIAHTWYNGSGGGGGGGTSSSGGSGGSGGGTSNTTDVDIFNVTLTGTGIVTLPSSGYPITYVLANDAATTGIVVPSTPTKGGIYVISNMSNQDWTTGSDFKIPKYSSWLLMYGGSSVQFDPNVATGWLKLGQFDSTI